MILHLSHNDLDGYSCSILTAKALKGVVHANLGYGRIDNYLLENYDNYDQIIVTDVYPEYYTVSVMSSEKEVVLLDHHESSEPLKDFPFTIHDNSRSATKLTYDWLTDAGHDLSEYADYVDAVNDYDLWLMQHPFSLKLNALFTMLGANRFVDRFTKNPSLELTDQEQFALTLEEERKEKYIENSVMAGEYMLDQEGRTFFVVYASGYNSELGNHVIQQGDCDYAVIINAQKRTVSLRSHSRISIKDIAERNGGGGHPQASAFAYSEPVGLYELLIDSGFLPEGSSR